MLFRSGIVEEVINIFPVNIIFLLLNPEVMYVWFLELRLDKYIPDLFI